MKLLKALSVDEAYYNIADLPDNLRLVCPMIAYLEDTLGAQADWSLAVVQRISTDKSDDFPYCLHTDIRDCWMEADDCVLLCEVEDVTT